ncbi:MATE family efflux transporter [Paenibacillus psychroresistens]|uniref:Probable multidrug resistance protein NorM n=1 Tax=Paenibacillus psychroresistens TaxID=1778678 RepID=A0A6B8RRI0_9BACL|nr:MATE family efflux transporter [Paenibacillus psychroresistens]QGQ97996.1 MATE family efflux transporter [Paenibacillus psychroresistens]
MFKDSKLILLLALPSILSFATVTLTGTISLIMVGQLGALVIAVVGVSNIIMYNGWALFSGTGLTVNYLVAQNYGAGELKKAVERTYIALYFCIIVAVLLVIAGFYAPGAVLRLMGGNTELVNAGEAYLGIRFFAMAFSVASFVLQGFFRGIGDTRTPLVLAIVGNAAMVFFTYSLTYGHLGFPKLGLPGAGWAFFIGEALIFAGSLYVFLVRLHARFGTRSRVVISRAEARLILTESGKLGVQEFATSAAMFIFTMFVTRLGTTALASNEVALNVMSFGFMPAFAFSATATILVGQAVGRGDPLQARKYGTETAILGSIFLLILGTIEFFLADGIARIYTSDPQVQELAARLIRVSAFLQLFDGLYNFYAGGLRGIGDTTFMVKASFLINWLIFVPLAYVLTFMLDMGSMGTWIALYTFLAIYGLAMLIRFYRTDWLQVQMKKA